MRVDVVIPNRWNDDHMFSECLSHLLHHHCVEVEDLTWSSRKTSIDIVSGISDRLTLLIPTQRESWRCITYRALSPVQTTKSTSSAHSLFIQSKVAFTCDMGESQSLLSGHTNGLRQNTSCRVLIVTISGDVPGAASNGPSTHETPLPQGPAVSFLPLCFLLLPSTPISSTSHSSSASISSTSPAANPFFFFGTE